MKSRVIFSVVAFLCAPLAHAQFGSGIVFDPTQSAHALEQIEQASQIYTTAVDTRDQIVTIYNLAHQMSQMPQDFAARYRADWSQWSSLQSTADTYGNTSALVSALNYGALAQSKQGYRQAYVQPESFPSGSYSSLDTATQAAVANQYATSAMAETTTTNALTTLGTIRSDSQAFTQKLTNLESDTFSDDPTEQTENALLGKINSAALLQIHSQQDTNQLLATSVEQQLIAHKEQIDARNRTLNNAIYFQQNFPNVMQQTTGGISQALQSISLSPSAR
jgi:hypothetical protein